MGKIQEKANVESKKIVDLPVRSAQLERPKKCWMGKARSIEILRNIWNLFREDGFGVRYLGGLTVICEWQSVELAKDCLMRNKEILNNWLVETEMWGEADDPTGRHGCLEFRCNS